MVFPKRGTRRLHISHNAPYLPLKFCTSIVFTFSWNSCNTLERWKTKVMQNLGGQIRCLMGDMQVVYLRKMRPFSWVYKGKLDHQEKVPTLPPSQALNCPAHTRDKLENFPMYDKRLRLHLQQPAWKDRKRNKLSYIVRTIIKLKYMEDTGLFFDASKRLDIHVFILALHLISKFVLLFYLPY